MRQPTADPTSRRTNFEPTPEPSSNAILELSPLNISARPAARPPTPITAPDPDMPKVTTCPAHTARSLTIPTPADDGDQDRVLVVAPDSPLPGPPAINRT